MELSDPNITFPGFLYGKFADVKKETSKVMTKLKKGVSIHHIAASYEYISPSPERGKIILDGPNPNNGFADYFHAFTLPRLLFIGKVAYEPKYRELMQTFFDEMMENPWSHLVMSTGQSVYSWYGNSEPNRVKYLIKLLEYRKQYLDVSKYIQGLPFQGWRLNGEEAFNITEIFDYPGFSGKFIAGNLEHTKKNFKDEEINSILVGNPLFKCIEIFGIDKYISTYPFTKQ